VLDVWRRCTYKEAGMAETKNYKPNKNFTDITQAGLKAYDLARKRRRR
jgi:hypothetical protein